MPRKGTSKSPDAQPEVAATSAEPPSSAPQKSYVPTTMTGLQDYSYWWAYAREHARAAKPNSKTFRRGRIWC